MEDVKLLGKIKAFLTSDGYGDGYGSGSGYGSGYGGLSEINGHSVFLVDNTPTIFTSVHENVAKGYMVISLMFFPKRFRNGRRSTQKVWPKQAKPP